MGEEQPPPPLEPDIFLDGVGLSPSRPRVRHERSVPHTFFQGEDGQPESKPLYDCPIHDESLEGHAANGSTASHTVHRQVSASSEGSMQSVESGESGRAMTAFLQEAKRNERRLVSTQHERKCRSEGVDQTATGQPLRVRTNASAQVACSYGSTEGTHSDGRVEAHCGTMNMHVGTNQTTSSVSITPRRGQIARQQLLRERTSGASQPASSRKSSTVELDMVLLEDVPTGEHVREY